MRPPLKWGKLPDMFVEWKTAADGLGEKRVAKYIDDLIRLKEVDVETRGDGVAREFYWRQHVRDLFDIAETIPTPAEPTSAPRLWPQQLNLFTPKK